MSTTTTREARLRLADTSRLSSAQIDELEKVVIAFQGLRPRDRACAACGSMMWSEHQTSTGDAVWCCSACHRSADLTPAAWWAQRQVVEAAKSDFYLFDGPSGKTVMAMTVNPDVRLSAPDTLHPEGLYAFRFDLDGDAREEVTFKFRFGEPRHGDGSEHTHIQPFVVRKATVGDALRGDAGVSLVEGDTGSVAIDSELRAYVGIAPDLFAANAGFRTFMTAFYKDQRFDADAILHQRNPFARRNVTAIVLEVPSELIGKGKINAWTTISLLGHAPEVQVSRWGLPMVTHLFLDDPSDQELKEQFNASVPSEDPERFAKSIAGFAEKMTIYAGSAADPGEYGKLIAARLCPNTLPYELGTSAAFEVTSFNGRALGDDALDVMLTLAANTPLVDGLAPDRGRIRKDFPYYGAPYTAEEQVGVRPMPRPVKK